MRLFCSSSGFEILRQSSLLALPPFWAALLGAAQDCFMFQLHLQPAVSCRALSKWENKPGAAGVPYMAVWGQVAPGMPLPPPSRVPGTWKLLVLWAPALMLWHTRRTARPSGLHNESFILHVALPRCTWDSVAQLLKFGAELHSFMVLLHERTNKHVVCHSRERGHFH